MLFAFFLFIHKAMTDYSGTIPEEEESDDSESSSTITEARRCSHKQRLLNRLQGNNKMRNSRKPLHSTLTKGSDPTVDCPETLDGLTNLRKLGSALPKISESDTRLPPLQVMESKKASSETMVSEDEDDDSNMDDYSEEIPSQSSVEDYSVESNGSSYKPDGTRYSNRLTKGCKAFVVRKNRRRRSNSRNNTKTTRIRLTVPKEHMELPKTTDYGVPLVINVHNSKESLQNGLFKELSPIKERPPTNATVPCDDLSQEPSSYKWLSKHGMPMEFGWMAPHTTCNDQSGNREDGRMAIVVKPPHQKRMFMHNTSCAFNCQCFRWYIQIQYTDDIKTSPVATVPCHRVKVDNVKRGDADADRSTNSCNELDVGCSFSAVFKVISEMEGEAALSLIGKERIIHELVDSTTHETKKWQLKMTDTHSPYTKNHYKDLFCFGYESNDPGYRPKTD